jgi:uncharacterized caspase-like protein
MLRAVIIVVLLALLPSHARAETRVALLIGNQSYDLSVGVLKNPHNDIAIVGQALSKQGFEVLPAIKDAKRSAILGGVRELVRRLNGAEAGAIGFVYYSGHGAAEKDTNINYLIPIDAKEPGTTAFWDESLKLDDILKLLDGARSAAKFIVFDACRNELQLPTKDTSKGLVPVAEQQGMFIAYASAPGHTASDKGDKGGPYATALAAELLRPGLDHLNLFQNVKEAVLASTGAAQQPWESNGIGRRVYFTGPLSKPGGPAQSSTSAQSPQISEAERTWSEVKDTKSTAVLEAFVERYKDTIYAELGWARLGELKKQQAEEDRQRFAMQQQQEDYKKRAEADAAKKQAASPLKSVAEIMTSWDMIGTWAVNCRRPPDNLNPHLGFSVAADSRVTFERDTKGRIEKYNVLQATFASNGSLEFSVRHSPKSSDTWKYTLAIGASGSRRVVDVKRIDGSEQLVRDGINLTTGRPTVWTYRCR